MYVKLMRTVLIFLVCFAAGISAQDAADSTNVCGIDIDQCKGTTISKECTYQGSPCKTTCTDGSCVSQCVDNPDNVMNGQIDTILCTADPSQAKDGHVTQSTCTINERSCTTVCRNEKCQSQCVAIGAANPIHDNLCGIDLPTSEGKTVSKNCPVNGYTCKTTCTGSQCNTECTLRK